ncbi:AMP-binding protein [Aquabacterium sp.]|uniref:AMP-binding protein n=1 Tax=Aquabacterium sp. TaxID=1872578 RepID=UPI002B67E9F1|nr:AMP-binding protein [Aquabacterium sp.]HSW06619.1 AMP-binding protein [Aquabacterium sp.]
MKPTLVFEGQVIDPDAFFDRYQRAAAALQALGIVEGDVVALMLHNSPLNLELMLATRWLGAVWCPVNWHFKAEELRYILADSGAKLFFAEDALLQALGDVAPAGVKTLSPAAWQALRDAAAPLDQPARAPRGPMLYTSGTTGRPKGIRREPSTPEQAATALDRSRLAYGLEPGMRALLSAPMYHSAPNAYAMGVAQHSGTLFLEARFDAEATLQLIEQHRITHAYLVPTMYVRLLRLPQAVRARHDLRSMRFVGSTGSPCPPEIKRAMIDWWGPVIYEAYGSSELGYMSFLRPEEALRKPGSAGRPIAGVAMRILDEQGHELPQGQAGLIYVKPSLAASFTYQGNDAARAAMEREGFLTMGDIGYLDDDGYLFIVDRSADMVISGGVNIYPAEIEATLQAMPGVADCAVFGIPDAEFGESLAAAVQPSADTSGAALTPEDVRRWLQPRLANYKLPRVVTLHASLPREDTGKIFKRKLRDPYWQGQARRI